MLFALLLALPSVLEDPVLSAVESFKRLDTYSVTLVSNTRGSREIIRYFYKKPGYVRMEFLTPRKGALLVYDPVKNKVRVRPFGFFRPFVIGLSPENFLIRSSGGHTVDKSDIGALLESVKELKHKGTLQIVGEENVNGRDALRVRVTGKFRQTVSGTHSYDLWMEKGSNMPLRVKAFDAEGRLTEEVMMDDLVIDPAFPDSFFEID